MRFLLIAALLGSFPQPAGHVNDFADIISPETENRMERDLRQYAADTGIEIAVATVASLDGLTVEEYALKLANSWGVGDAQKDNGLLFLVAPNERKTRIEVGYGLEPDLPDAAAGRIIRDNILPRFKNKEMEEGIVAGVSAILAVLGDMPFQQRLEERAKREAEIAEGLKFFSKMLFFISCFAVVAGMVFWAVLTTRKINRERKKLIAEAMERYGKFVEKFDKLRQLLPAALDLLEELNKEGRGNFTPELKPLSGALGSAKDQHRHLLTDLGGPSGPFLKHKSRGEIKDILVSFTYSCGIMDSYLRDIEWNQEQAAVWKEAKEKSPEMLICFPADLRTAKNSIGHADVSRKTKDMIPLAEEKYRKARKHADGDPRQVDWPKVFILVAEALRLVRSVPDKVAADIQFAQKAREKGPELFEQFPALLEETAEEVIGEDVSKETKAKLKKAEGDWLELKEKSGGNPNWILIFGALIALTHFLKKIREEAEKDKKKKREKKRVNAWSSGYGHAGYSPSNHSPSPSSNFGGFGGGSFGGGGASGSW